jgi:hypothetical protein
VRPRTSNHRIHQPWLSALQGTLGDDWEWYDLDGAPWAVVAVLLAVLTTWVVA